MSQAAVLSEHGGPASPELKVRVRRVYGRTHIIPVCETSQAFARLLRQQTLTEANLQDLKELFGFRILTESEEL